MKARLSLMPAFLLTASLAWCDCSPGARALLEEGRAVYVERMDPARAMAALTLFEKALAEEPACAEAAARASRAAWWVADQKSSKKDRVAFFQKGIDFAKVGIATDPNSADAHFWLAGNYGSLGETKGVMKSLALVGPIRKELAEVVRIDPAYDEGAAYRVLGAVDYKVPGFAGGSKKRAKENLTKSLELGPSSPFNHFYFAEYYATVGDKGKAREHLTVLKGLKAEGEAFADLVMMQKKGAALEKSLD